MTSPSEPHGGKPDEPVSLSKQGPEPEPPFDPYRFGLPDTPPPPEYAPPGWTPPSSAPPPGYPSTPYAGGPGQQPPYPPYPYGTTPYAPHGYRPVAQTSSNGKAVTALVLGILTILMFWTSVFDALLAIPAVVFGILAVSEASRRGGTGRGMAVAGLICAAVGAVLAIVWTVFIVHLANQCGGIDQTNSPGFQQCLRQHL